MNPGVIGYFATLIEVNLLLITRITVHMQCNNLINKILLMFITVTNCFIFFAATSGNLIGPAVSTLISGGLENLLRMPMGCGEQTMMFLAPNVYVLQYLSKTKQVTADIESRAYEMIQSGELFSLALLLKC